VQAFRILLCLRPKRMLFKKETAKRAIKAYGRRTRLTQANRTLPYQGQPSLNLLLTLAGFLLTKATGDKT
jgi:hypothetical protein